MGLDYIAAHFGEEAVRDYLREFSLSYYAPLKKELTERGLIKEHGIRGCWIYWSRTLSEEAAD